MDDIFLLSWFGAQCMANLPFGWLSVGKCTQVWAYYENWTYREMIREWRKLAQRRVFCVGVNHREPPLFCGKTDFLFWTSVKKNTCTQQTKTICVAGLCFCLSLFFHIGNHNAATLPAWDHLNKNHSTGVTVNCMTAPTQTKKTMFRRGQIPWKLL